MAVVNITSKVWKVKDLMKVNYKTMQLTGGFDYLSGT